MNRTRTRKIKATAWLLAASLAATGLSMNASAQVPQYGSNVTLDQTRRATAAADAEARRNNWPVAIAVVDNAGDLVLFQKHDNTQTASVLVAQDKAVSAAIIAARPRSSRICSPAAARVHG
jgi:uncharacterized protein GlcG (DUF336 family)